VEVDVLRPGPFLLILTLTLGCQTEDSPSTEGGQPDEPGQTADRGGVTAFVGATVWDGTGAPPLPDAVILVRDGRVAAVGASGDVEVPDDASRVDLTGRYVIPGMVNAHGHVGGTLGLEGGHYSEANVLDHLGLYARYGVTTVVSLGGDEEAGVRVRDSQATSDLDRARLHVAGAVVVGDSPEEALEVTNRNINMDVDFVKFRVDDNLGTVEKMKREVQQAVIERAHAAGLPVSVHVFYLDDAKFLLDAGADFIGHSVRDQDVDDAFLAAMRERDVCYAPTLMREVSTFIYESEPEFFSDPFFLKHADAGVVEALRDPGLQESVRASSAAQAYKLALQKATENLSRVHEAGIRVAMGTDSGPPRRFQGYFEHRELDLMAEAGMDPVAVLIAATRDAAACMGLDDVGTLEAGKWADLLVLGADPTADVANTRSLESVWIAGNLVPGSS
jgi:imidazolonepropionase-like amidohydrolase